jgi:hypothetical protein
MELNENSLTFHLKENSELTEVIKITKDGFFYKGEKIEDIYNVYERFNLWLSQAMVENPN